MEIKKSISDHQNDLKQKIANSFEKGVYKDNSENKRKQRVGQHYGGKKVEEDQPPTGYGYHIKNPQFSYNIGWLSDSKVRFGGWSVRNASDFDKENLGAQFRISNPHQEEYEQVEGKWVQNILHHSHPAKIENGWVKVLDNDNKWKVWKKAKALSFGNLNHVSGEASMYQDKYIPNTIPDNIVQEQKDIKALAEAKPEEKVDVTKDFMDKVVAEQEGRFKAAPVKFIDSNTYVKVGEDDYKLLGGDAKAEKLLSDTKEMRDMHLAAYPENMKKLAEMFPNDILQGRVKKMKSAMEKIIRKPKYGTTKALQDYTGFRVISDSVAGVFQNVAAFKKEYNVIEEDNYINEPLGDYRSYHIIGEKDGVTFEAQFRTKNQDSYANWAHNIYKPLNEAQSAMAKENSEEIAEYSKGMSAYYFAVDSGEEGTDHPPCTYVIKIVFGCL